MNANTIKSQYTLGVYYKQKIQKSDLFFVTFSQKKCILKMSNELSFSATERSSQFFGCLVAN